MLLSHQPRVGFSEFMQLADGLNSAVNAAQPSPCGNYLAILRDDSVVFVAWLGSPDAVMAGQYKKLETAAKQQYEGLSEAPGNLHYFTYLSDQMKSFEGIRIPKYQAHTCHKKPCTKARSGRVRAFNTGTDLV